MKLVLTVPPERVKLTWPGGGSWDLLVSRKVGFKIAKLMLRDVRRRTLAAKMYDLMEGGHS